MNREKIMKIAAAAGIILLVFYWTHLGFSSSTAQAKSDIAKIQDKIEKSAALLIEISTSKNTSAKMTGGLLSFLEQNAENTGLSGRLGGIKPKTVPGAAEAASIRLESLTYNETLSFLQTVGRYANLTTTNVRISKRFDNESLLNLNMDIVKK